MNPSPQQIANALAVVAFGSAASIYHTDPAVADQLGWIGGFLLGIAVLLSASPIQRAAKPKVIYLTARMEAVTQMSATLTAHGHAVTGFHPDVMARLRSGDYPTSPGSR
jgi:hypothetical protein